MVITHDVINQYFGALIAPPDGDVLSNEGFTALADWSERQGWWRVFAALNSLEVDWRTSYMGDPYVFSLTLFRFLVNDDQRSHLIPTLPPR